MASNVRLELLKQRLSAEGLDGALLTSPANVFYFTGFYADPMERFLALWIDVPSGKDILFVPALEMEAAKSEAKVEEMTAIGDTENPYTVLRKRVGSAAGRILGMEKKAISQYAYECIVHELAPKGVKDLEDMTMALRTRKSEEELDRIRAAVRTAEQALENSVKHIRAGMTELELAAEVEYQIRLAGGEKPAFSTSVLGGRRSALPHGKPGAYRLSPNDFILIDMGVYLEGYCSDITRTFLLGDGTEEQEWMYDTVLEANRRAIEAVRPHQPFSGVDSAARTYIESQGYGAYFHHRVGHGFGIEIHEPPSVHADHDAPILPGHVFTVEPGIYLPETGGVRIEDDVCVHEDGTVEVLSRFPKEMIRLSL